MSRRFGTAELIWRNTGGDVAIWQMNGTQVLSSPDLGNVQIRGRRDGPTCP
jgi:hypothetical protein